MAVELGLEVICEGVETKEQANMLENLGCHMAQGFLYDKPIPHDEFESRLTNGDYNV
jgi:EAL domain-containing protein (putative c-di-GMP-specific phosphodiesterase class I)